MGTKVWDWLKIILKFSFSFLILGYMVRSGRLDMAVVTKGFSHIEYLFFCAFLAVTALAFSLYRWYFLLVGQGIRLKVSQILRYGMIGAFFNTTMPGAVSGDLIKAWYIMADLKSQKKTPILTAILLDRVMGVFGLIIVSASPLIWNWSTVWSVPQLSHLAKLVLLLFSGVVCFFTFLYFASSGPMQKMRQSIAPLESNKIGKIILQVYDACVAYSHDPILILKCVLLSIGTHMCMVIFVILCGFALGEGKLAIYQYFLLVPIGLLTTAIPIAPAGLGVGHVAFAALFELAGSHQGAEVFTMLVSVQIVLNLTGVVFYLRSPKIQPIPAATSS